MSVGRCLYATTNAAAHFLYTFQAQGSSTMAGLHPTESPVGHPGVSSPVSHTSPDLESHLSAVNDFVATTSPLQAARAQPTPPDLFEARRRTSSQLEARLRWHQLPPPLTHSLTRVSHTHTHPRQIGTLHQPNPPGFPTSRSRRSSSSSIIASLPAAIIVPRGGTTTPTPGGVCPNHPTPSCHRLEPHSGPTPRRRLGIRCRGCPWGLSLLTRLITRQGLGLTRQGLGRGDLGAHNRTPYIKATAGPRRPRLPCSLPHK